MSAPVDSGIEDLIQTDYKYGFVSDIKTDALPPGLTENVICAISQRKQEPEFMLEWRLKAYRHWLTIQEPHWPNAHYPPLDYQSYIYYAAPAARKTIDS